MRAAKDQANLHIRTPRQSLRWLHFKRGNVDEGSGQIIYTKSWDLGLVWGGGGGNRYFLHSEQRKTMKACTLTQSRQIMFECLSTCEWQCLSPTFVKSDIKPALTTLVSPHEQNKTVIKPASYVTMVVSSIYSDKIVHKNMKLLSTTWQTCINA